MDVKMVLFGVGLSGLVSGVVYAVLLAIGSRVGSTSAKRWALGPALAAGYLAGQGATAWPSSDVTDRIPWIALGALILGGLEALWPPPAWSRIENRLIFAALAVLVMLGPAVQETWATKETMGWLSALGLVIVVAWASLEGLASRSRGVAFALPLIAMTGGAGAVMLLSGSLVMGQLGGALTAALAAAWVVSWWAPPLELGRGSLPVLVLILSALVLEAHVYASLTTVGAALVASSTLAPWVTRIGPIARLAPWKAAIIGVVLVLIPIGVAAGLAIAEAAASSVEY